MQHLHTTKLAQLSTIIHYSGAYLSLTQQVESVVCPSLRGSPCLMTPASPGGMTWV